jgi:hypothetical protein
LRILKKKFMVESRPIKKKGVQISKTEYVVFVQYEVEQTY